VQFDLSSVSIPESTVVTSAVLSLRRFDDSGLAPAACFRILESWSEESMRWYNMPGYDSSEAIAEVESDREWLEFDVTRTVIDFMQNQDNNFGFMLTSGVGLDTEIHCQSSEHAEIVQRPKLTITVENPNAIVHEKQDQQAIAPLPEQFQVLQNNGSVKVFLPATSLYTIAVFNIRGKQVGTFMFHADKAWYALPTQFSSGNYLLVVNSPQRKVMQKFSVVR